LLLTATERHRDSCAGKGLIRLAKGFVEEILYVGRDK